MKDGDGVACRGASPLAAMRWVSEVSTAGDCNSIRKADGGTMLPVKLSSAPCKGISSGLVIPEVGKVPTVALVGKDAGEAQELPVNLARGKHATGHKGGGCARLFGVGVTILRSCPLLLTSARWLLQNSCVRTTSTVMEIGLLDDKIAATCPAGAERTGPSHGRSTPANPRSSRGRPSCCQCASCMCASDHLSSDCRLAGLTGFHPELLRAAAVEELALQGTDRTTRSMQTCAALPAMSKSGGSTKATQIASIKPPPL